MTAPTGRLHVSPGQTIQSTEWGNITFDQTVMHFANNADRDAQFTAPPDGSVCYTVDTKTVWIRKGGQWLRLGQSGIGKANPPIVGSAFSGDWPLLFQGGSIGGTTTAQGMITYIFPEPFAHGLMTALATSLSSGNITATLNTASGTGATAVTFRVHNAAGAVVPNAAVGLSFIAMGW